MVRMTAHNLIDPTQPPGSTQETSVLAADAPLYPLLAGRLFDLLVYGRRLGPRCGLDSRRRGPGAAAWRVVAPHARHVSPRMERNVMRLVLFIVTALASYIAWLQWPAWPIVVAAVAAAWVGSAYRAARPVARRQVNPERYRLTLPL